MSPCDFGFTFRPRNRITTLRCVVVRKQIGIVQNTDVWFVSLCHWFTDYWLRLLAFCPTLFLAFSSGTGHLSRFPPWLVWQNIIGVIVIFHYYHPRYHHRHRHHQNQNHHYHRHHHHYMDWFCWRHLSRFPAWLVIRQTQTSLQIITTLFIIIITIITIITIIIEFSHFSDWRITSELISDLDIVDQIAIRIVFGIAMRIAFIIFIMSCIVS